jgi:hypothetical protein
MPARGEGSVYVTAAVEPVLSKVARLLLAVTATVVAEDAAVTITGGCNPAGPSTDCGSWLVPETYCAKTLGLVTDVAMLAPVTPSIRTNGSPFANWLVMLTASGGFTLSMVTPANMDTPPGVVVGARISAEVFAPVTKKPVPACSV